jgi:protease-4
MIRRLLVFALLLVARPSAAADPTLTPELLVQGNESVAHPDGPLSLLFNPAALGIRYPSEIGLTWLDPKSGENAIRGSLQMKGFRMSAGGTQDQTTILGLAFAGGQDGFRVGLASEWIPKNNGGRTADHRLGALSRPSPYFSLGGVVEHLTAPELNGVRLHREYTVGIGIRPLALSRSGAHRGGPRVTFTGDMHMLENDAIDNADYRLGAEIEMVPGLVVRGLYYTRDRGFQLGLSLLGVTAGYHAQSGRDPDGNSVYTTHNASFHTGEDRTVLASRRDARVAAVRVRGDLGDESLSGVTLYGTVGTTAVGPIHRQLEQALEDPLTRGVLLDVRGVSNMAQLEELRARIGRLRDAGKPVVAFLENGGRRSDLYLAAACDRVVATPEAFFPGLGLRSERRYYRTLLADWGVRLDRTSYGKYKSAFRGFSVDSTPPADRESIEHTLDVVQEQFFDAVTTDRGIERGRLEPVLDGRRWTSEDLRKAGLVDSIGYREDAARILGRLAGLGPRPRAVEISKRQEARREWTRPTRLAVIYAAGAIESGRSGNDLLMGPFMGAETMSRQIEAAFRNPAVEAVVLRVESTGGSSLASDLIHHTVARMKRETKKPLVVSMGGVAASGGYHISVPADRILADRFTVTGSIGVVLVKPSIQRWDAEHQVRNDVFERGRYMRGWSLHRDWDPEIQASADSATFMEYQDFVATVAEARKLSFEEVDEAAQGRVWLGEDALERKLVDQIGGLEDAIREAKLMAKIPEDEKIRIAEYRRPRLPLLQRLVGTAVSETWERSMRMPEPGEMLYWMADEGAP